MISSGITMSVPFVLGKILDTIFDKDGEKSSQSLDRLKHFSLILCGVFFIGGLANFGRIYLFNSACMYCLNNLLVECVILISIKFSFAHCT